MLDRQQLPNSIHLTVMRQNIPVIDTYIEDLKASILQLLNKILTH